MEGLVVSHVKEHLAAAVYVGRAVPRSGLAASPFADPVELRPGVERHTAIWRYHNHLFDRHDLIARLPELRGRTVACWCRRRDEPRTADTLCHADVLDLWLRSFPDDTLGWLGEHAMPGGWANELEARMDELLGSSAATGPAAGET